MAKIGMGEVIRVNRYSLSETDIIRMIAIAFPVISCTLITAISFSFPLTLIRYELFFIPVLYTTYFYARRDLVVAGSAGLSAWH